MAHNPRFLERDIRCGFQSTVTFSWDGSPQWAIHGFPGIRVREHSSPLALGELCMFTVRRRNRATTLPEEYTLLLVPKTRKKHLHQPYVTLEFDRYEGDAESRSCTLVLRGVVRSLSQTPP